VLALTTIGFSRNNLFDSARMFLETNRSSVIFGFFAGILGSAYHTPGPRSFFVAHWGDGRLKAFVPP
jgi:hypothetical protein